MRYFEFTYMITEEGKIVKQGNALYYTSAEQNLDEMKKLVRQIENSPAAVVSISLWTEIDREVFLQKGGNPKA